MEWSSYLYYYCCLSNTKQQREVFPWEANRYIHILEVLKFAYVLATMGDLLSARILYKDWKNTSRSILQSNSLGIIGVVTTHGMSIHQVQVSTSGWYALPFEGIAFANALFKSATMNILMSPTVFYSIRLWTVLQIKIKLEAGAIKVKLKMW